MLNKTGALVATTFIAMSNGALAQDTRVDGAVQPDAGESSIVTDPRAAEVVDDGVGLVVDLEVETGVSSVFSGPTAADEITDVYGEATLNAEWRLGAGIAAFTEITVESVLDPTDDRFFEDIGAYIATLGLTYSHESFTVGGGKIHPAFGVAWDAAPGFFGTDLAEDYELSEAIGFFVDVPFVAAGGEHTASLAVFYTDTSALSESWGTNRGRTSVADGGAGNTEELNNFAFQLDGAFGEMAYNLGFRKLSAGQGDVSDETGGSLALAHDFDVNGNTLSVLGEVAYFNGFGGTADDVTYATLSGAYAVDNFTYTASLTNRDGVGGFSDTLVSVGMDYDFGDDLVASVGLGQFEEGGSKSKMVGFSINKVFSFGS
jgi:hypothetical protein